MPLWTKTHSRQLVERLQKVSAVIKTLDEAIRPEAFKILRPYIDGKPSASPTAEPASPEQAVEAPTVDAVGAEAFVRSQDITKPADAVKAIAAWWFSEYGLAPLTKASFDRIAHEVGVTVPNRPDATLRGMKSDGKPVFRQGGRGTWIPTRPHGELFFRNQYGVTKRGNKEPPSTDDL